MTPRVDRSGQSDEIKCALLAAGLGRRLEPLTLHRPKPLFPLGGKTPLLEVWVRHMVAAGIRDVSMNLCVLPHTIRQHFEESPAGATIRYIEESTPSGTLGGACKQTFGIDSKNTSHADPAPDLAPFQGSTVIVPSGDIASNFDAECLQEMHRVHKAAGAAMTIILVPVPWERRKDYGTVVLDRPESRKGLLSRSGRIEQFLEKDPDSPSNLNNASIYMIETELLEALDSMRTPVSADLEHPFYDFGKHVFPAMLGRLEGVKLPKDFLLWGIEYDGVWFDVGQKRDYLQVNESVLDGELCVPMPYEKRPWGYVGTDVEGLDQAKIEGPAVIGSGCRLAPGVELGPYAVIGDGWTIERDVTVSRSVLWGVATRPADVAPSAGSTRVLRRGARVHGSIVTGGEVDGEAIDQTIDPDDGTKLRRLPIDYVPEGPRL
ncbi:MAG: NDP-sugar synthase [bacterium]|nr:NDP-sugar synthase [bacterium]